MSLNKSVNWIFLCVYIYIYIIYSFFTSLLSDYINGVFEASVEIWGKIPLASPGCRDKEGNRENQHGNCPRLNPCPPRAARGIPSGIHPVPSWWALANFWSRLSHSLAFPCPFPFHGQPQALSVSHSRDLGFRESGSPHLSWFLILFTLSVH